jgi:hypothetical protein
MPAGLCGVRDLMGPFAFALLVAARVVPQTACGGRALQQVENSIVRVARQKIAKIARFKLFLQFYC